MSNERLKSEVINDIDELMIKINATFDNISNEEMKSKDAEIIDEIYDIVFKLHEVVMEKLKTW